MKMTKRILPGTGLSVFLLALALALIVWPAPLFAYTLNGGRISIASDEPIPEAVGRQVLTCQQCDDAAVRRLSASSTAGYLLLEKQGWSVDKLLKTRLSLEHALCMMR